MSTPVTVIYWRDIPAQVVSGQGRGAVRAMLSDRFQEAIDRAATRAGMIGSDEYMAQWRKHSLDGGEVQVVADQLDTDYPDTVLEALVRNYGRGPAHD